MPGEYQDLLKAIRAERSDLSPAEQEARAWRIYTTKHVNAAWDDVPTGEGS